MKKFKLVDSTLGWLAFLIAAFVYCSTIEPTASFWDCPEFITTGYKLEIGHPPGSPFFALTANLFSHFASDASQVARMMNTMSALLSATCIMFLFWTISHLARKLIVREGEDVSLPKLIAIEGAALVGALIYTFSDTFWFSAVESEVYAYSSAFTAIVFWLILKWEDNADKPHADRWLVLIAYMMGLSIGVHLLNLLCIPAIVLVYYYKRVPETNLKGSMLALGMSIVLVAAVLYGVVPGIITVGGWFELFFTNTLGMPFNTGTIIYIVLMIASFVWAIYETYRQNNVRRANISFLLAFALIGIPFYGYGWGAFIVGIIVLAIVYFLLQYKKNNVVLVSARFKNTALLCMLMLLIGYSSYALVVIRSTANPPMDQNSPEDIFTLGSYLSRDQYGERPLLYGQAYSSQRAVAEDGMHYKFSEGAPVYQRKEKASKDEKDSYFLVRHKSDLVYQQNMFFPRMWDVSHTSQYEQWMGGIKGREVDGAKIPTQFENLKFFFSYQCNFMYWRYFMWNFAGRQNDLQGNGEPEHGNWITGISFIDNAIYGDQNKMPNELKNNKAHNVFYCLPLLLGLLGLFWQAWRGKRGIQQFWIVFFLFFMTGLAIVVYLNQTPSQPRERDYAYAGSFYAFAIWCGLGIVALYDWAKKLKLPGIVAASLASIVGLLVPIQMASQTWDDHDRSNRYTCRDYGQNYLNSLQKTGNPIIFTNGDNDTFPLWYNQEVEGVRLDSRVCNLSYLTADWYIDQMRRPAYTSPSVPISWPRLEYVSGTNDYVPVVPDYKKQVLDFYKEDPKTAKAQFGEEPFELKNILRYWVRSKDANTHVIPTDTVFVTIDKNAVRRSGMMIPGDSIPDRMIISLAGKDALYKNDLMMLEMIANCNWTRPLYVAITVGSENFMNLGDNFIQEGFANRITPFTTTHGGNYDTAKSYDIMMNRFKWGGISRPGIYIDETLMRMCYTHRREMTQLALQLLNEGKKAEAIKVLKKAEKEVPVYNVPLNFLLGRDHGMALAYASLGQNAKAKQILESMIKTSSQYIGYYLQLPEHYFDISQATCKMYMQMMMELIRQEEKVDRKVASSHYKQLSGYVQAFTMRGGTIDNQ